MIMNQAQNRKLKEIWDSLDTGNPGPDTFRRLKEIHRNPAMESSGKRPFLRRVLVPAAAAVLLLVGVGIGLSIGREKQEPSVRTTTRMCYMTSGAMTQFDLPDGTKVWLNAGSSLSYDSESFSESPERRISLEGECFFDVVKNGKPFYVDFGQGSVRVVGTRFMVRHYERNEDDMVVLESGSVEVSSGDALVPLSPGQTMVLERGSGRISVSDGDISFDTDWMDHELNLKRVALSDLIKSVSHRYNVDIRLADGYSYRKRISLEIRNETLDQVLSIISIITGCKIRKVDDYTVLISGK